MTVARAARLLALGVLMSFLIAGGPAAAVLALLAAAVLLAATGPEATAIFHLPRWVFRALALPAPRGADAPALARAWWVQS